MESRNALGYRLSILCEELLVNTLDEFHKAPEDVVGLAVKIANRDDAGVVWLPIVAECESEDVEGKGTYRIEVSVKRVD